MYLLQLMLVSSSAQKNRTPFISKRNLNTFQEPKKKRSVNFRELAQCHHDDRVADDDETVCLLQPAVYFTGVENGATPEEQFITCQQQYGGEPDNAEYGCLKFWGELMKCVTADEDGAGRLSSKRWRYKYLCYDLDNDDCIDSSEFVKMLAVGFEDTIIDALAFKDLTELMAEGYGELDQKCAQIFL